MKGLSAFIAGVVLVWAVGTAFGGYRDLKREIDDHAPPVPIGKAESETPAVDAAADNLKADEKAVDELRRQWTGTPSGAAQTAAATAIPPAIAAAAADDSRTLDLLQGRFSPGIVEALILVRSPAIKGATDRFRAALEGFGQVTQLDEILRQYAAFTEGVMPGVGSMQGMDSIQMKFPFPGVTALKGQVAEKNVEAEKESLDLIRRDTVVQGRKAYWNLLYTHRAQRITRDMLDRLNQLESVATTRYGAGKTSYQDVIKIRIGREKLVEQLATLKEQRTNLETELLALVDLPAGQILGIPESLPPEPSVPKLDVLYPLAQQNRQELRRMRAMVGKMERMVEMAETMILPSYSQNYSLFSDEAVLQVGRAAMKPTFATVVSPTRGKGLPKNAWFGTQDAYLQETRRKLDALRAELADAEARTRLMVRTGWFDLDQARRERSLFKDRLLGLSQTSLEVSTRGYESGSVSFADVIGSYTGWLEINLTSERRTSDVGIARAELERRIGAPLP